MSEFALHSDFQATSMSVGELHLCHVRLQDDRRWPWLILIPRIGGMRDLDDLSPADQGRLIEDQGLATAAVRAMGAAAGRSVEKLNVAALGNVTPQLHVHIIGRRRDDAAWPRPVWGVGEAEPYSEADRAATLAVARSALGLSAG